MQSGLAAFAVAACLALTGLWSAPASAADPLASDVIAAVRELQEQDASWSSRRPAPTHRPESIYAGAIFNRVGAILVPSTAPNYPAGETAVTPPGGS